MEKLLQDLQDTIVSLETLSASAATASDQIDELLDQLFQQKIDLVNASLNAASEPYRQAAQAIGQAAAKAARAVKEPARIGEMTTAVEAAISRLARLLDNAVPTE